MLRLSNMFRSQSGAVLFLVVSSAIAVAQSASTSSPAKPHAAVRFNCGEYKCVALYAGEFEMAAAQLFAGADPDLLRESLLRHSLPSDRFTFRIQSLYVDTGKNRVIIDPGGIDASGVLLASLVEAGIDPVGIDTVVITHGHYDHFRGSVAADGTPVFRNATYFLQKGEWEHWIKPNTKEAILAEGFQTLLVPLRKHFTLLEGDEGIVPGIRAFPTPGHSPAHMAVLLGGKAIYTGDVLLNPVHVEHPDWAASFDLLPEQVVASRRALLDRAAKERLLVVTTHFAPINMGRVEPSGSAWRWIPEAPEQEQ